MRSISTGLAALFLSTTLVACGDKSDDKGGKGGDTGGGKAAEPAQVVDPTSPVGTWKADMTPIISMMRPMIEMGLKMAESMAPEGGDPAEKAKKIEEAKKQLAELEKAEMVMTLKKDGTATFFATMSDGPEDGTGTWSQSGDQVTVTMKTSGGKPAEGNKAEAKTLTFKDNTLLLSEGPMSITFRRK